MNGSRCQKIWTVGRQDLTSGYSANKWGVGVNRCHVGVQYLGEGVVSWTDVVGVKGCQGVRDAKESVSWEVWDTNVRIGLSLFLQEQQW